MNGFTFAVLGIITIALGMVLGNFLISHGATIITMTAWFIGLCFLIFIIKLCIEFVSEKLDNFVSWLGKTNLLKYFSIIFYTAISLLIGCVLFAPLINVFVKHNYLNNQLLEMQASFKKNQDEDFSQKQSHYNKVDRQLHPKSQKIVDEYITKIQEKVNGRINKEYCTSLHPLNFKVKLLPNGEFAQQPTLTDTSGSSKCDDEVERAIIDSEPFLLPADSDLKILFRDLTLRFNFNADDVEQVDYETIFRLHFPFAEEGVGKAQITVANMYYKGQGVKQDYEQAFKWYKKAANQGFAVAHQKLGVMYQNGIGTDIDYVNAYLSFSFSANLSLDEGKESLVSLIKLMNPRELEEARELAKE
jgi:TPR repeat protein